MIPTFATMLAILNDSNEEIFEIYPFLGLLVHTYIVG
jgi:hypothetical protein